VFACHAGQAPILDAGAYVPFAGQSLTHVRLDHCDRQVLHQNSLLGQVRNASLGSGAPASAIPLGESELEQKEVERKQYGLPLKSMTHLIL